MTTPEARPEAVAVTEEMVEAAAGVLNPALFCDDPPFVPHHPHSLRDLREKARKRARAALEAASHVRSAQDHGGEANEMIGEPRSGRMSWHLKQAEARAIAASARAAKAGEALQAALDWIDAVPAAVAAALPAMPGFDRDWANAAFLSDHPAPEPGVEAAGTYHDGYLAAVNDMRSAATRLADASIETALAQAQRDAPTEGEAT